MALTPVAAVKDGFINEAGAKKVLPNPKGPRVKKGSDEDASSCKILVFGKTGSGKTNMIVGLLLHGLKVFVICTDFGGEGMDTVKLELIRLGRRDLLDNYNFVVLGYDDVQSFIQNPTNIYKDFYKDNFDFLVWDGFTGYQQIALSDKVGDMNPAGSEKDNKVISDGRQEGLQFEQQDWGMIKTGTVRPLNKFLAIYNLETGMLYHKLVTCLEEIRTVKTGVGADAKTTYVDANEPMLQGAARRLIGPAFDLILRTRIRAPEGKEKGKRVYEYECAGYDNVNGPKTRGLDLDPVMEGDMYKLWEKIATQKGIKRGAISSEFEKEQTTSVS